MAKSIDTEAKQDLAFHRYEDSVKNLVRVFAAKADTVKLGGGKESMEKHRKRGKLPARERIQKLIDPDTRFIEIGLFAAYGMYEEYGGAPSSGTVIGIGKIHGRDVMVVAND